MQVVIDLDRRVDSQDNGYFLCLAIGAMNCQHHVLTRSHFPAFQSSDVERLGAVEVQRRGVDAFFELAREHAHAHEVTAMDAFEALRDDGLHSQQPRSLCGPVAS